MKKILVTGSAGFIGFHLVQKLINENYKVIGIDNINDYYDINLKYARLKESGIKKGLIEYNKSINSSKFPNYNFIKLDLTDKVNLSNLFKSENFDFVINLAAQAGVRYSLTNPDTYIQSNIVGFANVLECCRHNEIKHLIYASSSSVYGLNKKQPFSPKDNVDYPISLYASTKKSNELMAHSYSYLYDLPTTGLRFFTVYGPWGRPDMAYYLFASKIHKGQQIDVYNYGKMERDFTYIDDIIQGIHDLIVKIPSKNKKLNALKSNHNFSTAPYNIFNIGNNKPIELMLFIEEIEKELGRKAKINLMPLQPGDVLSTFADIDDLKKLINYRPKTNYNKGIKKFISWYLKYYRNN